MTISFLYLLVTFHLKRSEKIITVGPLIENILTLKKKKKKKGNREHLYNKLILKTQIFFFHNIKDNFFSQ